MKYLDKKFNSPANSKAYIDNWDMVFADRCKRCGRTLVDGCCPNATPPAIEDGETR